MTSVFSPLVRALGRAAFKTSTTPLKMSFSSSSCLILSSGLPSKPDQAGSSPDALAGSSLMGAASFSRDRAQL